MATIREEVKSTFFLFRISVVDGMAFCGEKSREEGEIANFNFACKIAIVDGVVWWDSNFTITIQIAKHLQISINLLMTMTTASDIEGLQIKCYYPQSKILFSFWLQIWFDSYLALHSSINVRADITRW